jgi:multidrug resistance efflux pump
MMSALQASRRRAAAAHRFILLMVPWARRLATLAILMLAIVMSLLVWEYYVTAPWTRDGRVRVQVASVAPQVSGRIIEVRTADNQFVRKGDVLYVIDPFDYEVAVQSSRALVEQKAADLQVKQVQSDRRQHLSMHRRQRGRAADLCRHGHPGQRSLQIRPAAARSSRG